MLNFSIFCFVKVSGFICPFLIFKRWYYQISGGFHCKVCAQQMPYLGKECIEYASLILFWQTGIEFQNSELFLVPMAIHFILLKLDENTL